jgi:protein TonB
LLDDARPLFKSAAAISVGVHLALLVACLILAYWPKDSVIGTPQEQILDVTIVPLSALDTLLPKGETSAVMPASPPEVVKKEEPKVRPPARKKIEDPKDIVSSQIQKPKLKPDSSNNGESSGAKQPDAEAITNSGKLGVSNGADISPEEARISYQDMVATLIARAKRYPERALKRRMTGEGAIRLEISSDGSLANVEILRSTETQILDEELKAMAERAAPFPAFPTDLRKNKLALVVPIAFRLES